MTSLSSASSSATKRELLIIAILFVGQLLNILEFMIVMPLGPDFAKDLNFDSSKLGLIGTSYTFSAALVGLLGSFYLDRFDRKKIMLFCIVGLSIATFLAGNAQSFQTLLIVRIFAGAMGGPMSSMAMAILSEVVPAERRGKAIGTVMGAFAVASVIGVPIGLELALWYNWRMPFYFLSVLAVLIFILVWMYFPSLTAHLKENKEPNASEATKMFKDKAVLMSLIAVPTVFAGSFMVIPNIAAFIQNNLGFPRGQMSFLYLYGGIVALFTTQIGGRVCDLLGSFRVSLIGTVLLVIVLTLGFIIEPSPLPVSVIFVLFMGASSLRNVAFFTKTSKVPHSSYRARFMSLQSALNHISIAAGAFLSSLMLVETHDKKLEGMGWVAGVAILICIGTPWLIKNIKIIKTS